MKLFSDKSGDDKNLLQNEARTLKCLSGFAFLLSVMAVDALGLAEDGDYLSPAPIP